MTKRRAYQDEVYWGKPVPGFGDPRARILVVGLAPGAHGSNRTGRMFTGDASGDFLFPALYRTGFATQPEAISRNDSLELRDLFITAVGRCAPPANKPNSEELRNCQPFLLSEIRLLAQLQGIVALGQIAFDRVMRLVPGAGGRHSQVEVWAWRLLSTGRRPALAAGLVPSQPPKYPDRTFDP